MAVLAFGAMSQAPELHPLDEPELASHSVNEPRAIAGSTGLSQFAHHFAPNEPNYVVGGWVTPHLKFQVSFRYMPFSIAGSIARKHPWVTGFNFGYSQTGFMDVSTFDDSFFADTSYRPEVFYYFQDIPGIQMPAGWGLGLQGGYGHESNGFKKPEHRSLNILYLRPIFTIGSSSHTWFVTFAPKVYLYLYPMNLNRDMPEYRGYVDLRILGGWRDGLQLAMMGRVGNHFDRGGIQLDLTYPLTQLSKGNIDFSLTAQYFVGYGEGLLDYRDFRNMLRFGLTLVR